MAKFNDTDLIHEAEQAGFYRAVGQAPICAEYFWRQELKRLHVPTGYETPGHAVKFFKYLDEHKNEKISVKKILSDCKIEG